MDLITAPGKMAYFYIGFIDTVKQVYSSVVESLLTLLLKNNLLLQFSRVPRDIQIDIASCKNSIIQINILI